MYACSVYGGAFVQVCEHRDLCSYWNARKMYIYFINKNDIVFIMLCLFVFK